MFNAMKQAAKDGENLDEIGVGLKLQRINPSYEGNAFKAVSHYFSLVETSAQLEHHFSALSEAHKVREITTRQRRALELLEAGDTEAWREKMRDVAKVAKGIGGSQKFTVRGVSEILSYEIPADHGLVRNENKESLFELGSVAGIVGPPGVGKSRMALQLAIAQITGRQWCNLDTISPPRKWLLIGNENSRRRIARDLQGMTATLAPEKVALLKDHLFMQVPETDGDMVIALKSDNMARWRNTLGQTKPDALIIDPFEACLENYDVNDAAAVRDTIQKVASLAHEINPDCVVIFVHHARTGALNVQQATGFGKDDFAKGSKTFTSMIRLQINIAPGDADDFGKLVVSVGKSNDAKPFYPQGVSMNEETRLYEAWQGFDYEAWKEELATVGAKRAKAKDKAELVRRIVDGGTHNRKDIVAKIIEQEGVADKTARRWIMSALKKNLIRPLGLEGQFATVQ